MTLAGSGVVAIWNDVVEDGLANFYAWHNGEHMPERLSVPGFRRGRRYRAVDRRPGFFTLYEVADPAVLTGADYLARLNAPTEWTRRSVRDFRSTRRALCVVEASTGQAAGGFILTRGMDSPPVETSRPHPMMVARHLCRSDLEASSLDTAEKKARDDRPAPAWIELAEFGAPTAGLAPDELFQLEMDIQSG